MKAFVEFSSAGFAEFKIGFSRIAVSILNGFEAVNYKWATEGDGVEFLSKFPLKSSIFDV